MTGYLRPGLVAGGTNPGGSIAGNDSNNGSSYALGVMTFNSGVTAARSAPGDVWRVQKSEDPVSLGITATWTNKSATVTLASALTATIAGSNSWTASANVTCTTSSTRKYSSASSSIAIASAFTTGKAAYYAPGTLNLSGYNKVSFWIRSNATVASGVLRIDLCSDAAGATPVNSLTINEGLAANSWKCIVLDSGAALGSSIASIALYCVSDPGTVTLLINNVEAANALTHSCLISPSGGATDRNFYPIKSINGTSVILDQGSEHAATSTARGYSGTTTTATIYKREPIRVTAQTTQEAGTDMFTKITYSGGWDTTDMSTQTGLTFLDLGDASAVLLSVGQSFIDLERIVVVRGAQGVSLQSGNVLTQCAAIGVNTNGAQAANFSAAPRTYSDFIGIACNTSGILDYSGATYKNVYVYSCGSDGISLPGSTTAGVVTGADIIANNNGAAGLAAGTGETRFARVTCSDNASYGVESRGGGGILQIFGYTASGNTSGAAQAKGGILRLHNTSVSTQAYNIASSSGGARIEVSCHNGDPTDNRTYEWSGLKIQKSTDASKIHGTATLAQQHSPDAMHTVNAPLIQYIQPIPVAASGTHTCSVWVTRDSTNIAARLMLRGGQCSGETTDNTADASAAINTLEQLTLTTTPGQAVPLQFEFHTWRVSGSGNAWFSDMTASQA